MAKLQIDEHLQINLCVLALNIIQQLKNNSPERFTLTSVMELEVYIYSILLRSGFNESVAILLFENYNHANGYAILAEKEEKEGNDAKALELVEKGIALDNKSIWLMRIKVNLIKKQNPEDYDEIYDTLIAYQRRRQQVFDLKLDLELARLQFIRGEWAVSRISFRELGRKSKGYRQRLIPLETDRWIAYGEPKRLLGVIVNRPTFEEWGALRSNKPVIPHLIRVRYQDMKFGGYLKDQRVSFEIVFNMLGPQASNVKPR